MNKLILITGAAGFIGFHLSKKFLDNGYFVVGVDNFNSYYDVKLKESRFKILSNSKNFIVFNNDTAEIITFDCNSLTVKRLEMSFAITAKLSKI